MSKNDMINEIIQKIEELVEEYPNEICLNDVYYTEYLTWDELLEVLKQYN